MQVQTSTVAAVNAAPVVSVNSTSPEALLARKARALELQSETDSSFDTKLERTSVGFCGGPEQMSLLLGLTVAASILLASCLYKRR
jgi:hypothetical protein